MDIHAAAISSASLCRYLSEAHALSSYSIPHDWRLETAFFELHHVAKELGFDLIKREEKKEAA